MSDGLRQRDQVEIEGKQLVLLSLLGTAESHRTWVAAGADAQLQVARRISGRSQPQRARLLRLMKALQGISHPSLLSPSHAWEHERTVWVVRPHDGGVSLRRLVAVARLSPRQVAALADDVLDGLAALHAAGVVHGALHSGNILVGVDGKGRIADIGLGRRPVATGVTAAVSRGKGRLGGDLEAAAAALRAALAEPSRRGGAAAAASRISADHRPLEALLNGPAPGLEALGSAEAALGEVRRAAGVADPRTQREIAALVAPLVPPRPVVPPPLGAAPPSAQWPPARPTSPLPVRPSDRGDRSEMTGGRQPLGRAAGWRAPGGRRLAGLLIAMAAAVLVATALVVMGGHHPQAGPLKARLGPSATPEAASTPSPPSASAQPRGALLVVPPPAPPTDGMVTGLTVSLSGSAGCTAAAGQSCRLRVQVDLAPHQPQTPVSFGLVVVDRCTGGASTAPGSSLLAASGFGYVWADSPVAFSSGDPVMLYAVTSAPARAASSGLALPGSRPAC